MMQKNPGKLLRQAIEQERPLQIVGTVHAYAAIQAQSVGYRAIYLSGGGVAVASHGMPDLAMTNATDVAEDIRRITNRCDLPLLVDADTGFGNPLTVARTVRQFEQAGSAGLHLEDQTFSKRCGHRAGKQLVSTEAMIDRLKAALDARTQSDYVIMARTDALANEGIDAAIERAQAYEAAGADCLFPEAITQLADYRRFCEAVTIPVLANITEFGQTPLFNTHELAEVGVRLVLYPLSAFRAMSLAALTVYQSIRDNGSQADVVDTMQTRAELYQTIEYETYERQIKPIKE